MRLITSRPSSSSHVLGAALFTLCVFVSGPAHAQIGIPAEAVMSTGLQAERSYFSPLPFEHFDPSNGNIVLSFVDLELPGNAGRPLRFTRTYNTQSAPGGEAPGYQAGYWTFGIEGLAMRVVERPPLPSDYGCERANDYTCYQFDLPSFMFADGGERRTMWVGQPSAASVPSQYHLVTTNGFIYYDRSTGTMEYPNGLVAHYDSILHPDGTRTGTGRLLDFVDQFGNTVTLNQTGSVLTVTQSLGTNPSRVVTLALNADGLPDSMTYTDAVGTRVWQYGYSESTLGYAPDFPIHRSQHVLETVTLPGGGPGWQFGYGDYQQWFITPQGGRVDYHFGFDTISLPDGGSWPVSWLSSRTSGADSWTLTTLNLGGGPEMVIDISDGTRVTYEFKDWSQDYTKPWLNGVRLKKKTIEQPVGNVLETTLLERQLVTTVFSAQGKTWGTPEPSTQTITRDGRTYTTTYAYSSTLVAHHQPHTVTESSAGQTRITSWVWGEAGGLFAGTGFVAGLPLEQHVQVGSEQWQRQWFYSSIGFLEKTWDWFRAPDASGHETTFTPDAHGNVASVTKGNNKTTTLSYAWGAVKDTTTPEYVASREINPDGTVASETQAGRATLFQYDPLDRYLTQTQPPGGPSQSNPVSVTIDPDRHWVRTARGASSLTTTFDGFGRAIATVDSLGVQTQATYDLHGRVTHTSAPFAAPESPQETVASYDALGRVTEQTTPDNLSRVYVYGPGTVTIQENGHDTTQTWSAFGSPADARLTAVEDAKHSTWTYGYDALGALVSVSAPGGFVRSWAYNTRHELVSETHPESGTITYGPYDGAGVLQQKTDARGQTFAYTYDNNDRLRRVTVNGDVTDITYEPGSDNRATMSNGSSASTFLWEASTGRAAGREDVIDGAVFNTRYEYDLDDRVKSIFYPAFGSATNRRRVGYQFDSENRISRVFDLQATRDYAYDFHYQPSGALQEFRSGNGVRNLMTFDPQRSWLTSSSVSDLSGGGIWTLQYQNFDAAGNVGTIVDSRPGLTQTFQYDELDRLTAATGPYGAIAFAYDAHGNRLDANSTTYTYEPGTLRLQTHNGETFVYDNNGNLQTGANKSFTYTPRNMLATATVNGSSAAYAYDADDWRIKKTSGSTATYYFRGLSGELLTEWKNPGPNGETTDYVYAGSRLIATIGKPENSAPNDLYGTIVANGPTVPLTFTTAGQRAKLTFEGVVGERVSVVLTPTGAGTPCLAWPLAILKPDGQVLTQIATACGKAMLEPVALPASGTYTVLIDPNGSTIGPANVNLYDVVDISGTVAVDGPSVSAPLLTPGQVARFTFAGAIGQRISVTGTWPSGCLGYPFAILRESGATLASVTACGNTLIEPVSLPANENYTVFIDPDHWAVGTAVVSLYDVVDLTTPISIGGGAVGVPLTKPGQKASLPFTGVAGQRVSAFASWSGTSCLAWPLAILKPDLTSLATSSYCGSATLTGPAVLPTNGNYTLRLDPNASVTGTATLTLFAVPADVTGSLTVNAAATPVSLSGPGQIATFTFVGSAGQAVTVRVTGNSIGSTKVSLRRPDGTNLTYTTSSAASFNLSTMTLATAGTYSVVVDPELANTGSLSVRVTTP